MSSAAVDTCCLNCKKTFSKKCAAVGCLVCGGWCHTTCADVGKEMLNIIETNPTIGIVCDSCKMGNRTSTSSSTTSEFAALRNDIKRGFQGVNLNVNNLSTEIADIKKEFTEQIKLLKNELTLCKQNSDTLSSKICLLETENNRILKRMNRCDIIVNGIPDSQNIKNVIINMCKHLNAPINEYDIQQCFFLGRKKIVFLKLNSADVKDNIMQNYFKLKNLKLSDFVDIDINSRVYLNNNLTPLESKLSFYCRGLVRSKQIKKFRLLHTDIPKVKLELHDGSTKTMSHSECMQLFGGN